MLGAILVPFMGAVGSIAEGRPLMAGSTLRSLFEGDCSGFETGSRTLEWLYTVCGTAFRAVSDYCRMRARRHARNSKGYGVLTSPNGNRYSIQMYVVTGSHVYELLAASVSKAGFV